MPMPIGRMGLTERLAQIGETVLGVILAATPLALWIAWTPALLGCVVLAAIACAALLVVLTEFLQGSAQDRYGAEGARGRVVLPAQFVEEMHRLFPLIYHNALRESSRFRKAMQRMSGLI